MATTGYTDKSEHAYQLTPQVTAQLDSWVKHFEEIPLSDFNTTQKLPVGYWICRIKHDGIVAFAHIDKPTTLAELDSKCWLPVPTHAIMLMLSDAYDLLPENIAFIDENYQRPVMCIGSDSSRDIIVGMELMLDGNSRMVLVDIVDFWQDMPFSKRNKLIRMDAELIYKTTPGIWVSEAALEGFTGIDADGNDTWTGEPPVKA